MGISINLLAKSTLRLVTRGGAQLATQSITFLVLLTQFAILRALPLVATYHMFQFLRTDGHPLLWHAVSGLFTALALHRLSLLALRLVGASLGFVGRSFEAALEMREDWAQLNQAERAMAVLSGRRAPSSVPVPVPALPVPTTLPTALRRRRATMAAS
ncbi:uncharacterized protein L3040_000358 [Drepanopeziza brunnea f. sp. 'multigermtubi']|uniref:Uncharacterized protein n=1 Tax=Marssonina brunnea f. sp. multigermtubi (strain MB_m1) TaxID=1072389 RepID=K1X8U4_MARBU|nr:uncharacterized protein MBM_04695 [Drepanopeziza brunnea f. sp. 'multigermtubi' MB_m1]EKD17118.1 hypothetical protein MBM_04695 [Drepanopeziza brunnea f. sp. 'multigermtubi' MB_m1]KAJ5054074.1 hypothetical protein L3040_000358 [Drepanopeziza brunnea f. sp. 'multigermtubi']